jgi:hypothetical protein
MSFDCNDHCVIGKGLRFKDDRFVFFFVRVYLFESEAASVLYAGVEHCHSPFLVNLVYLEVVYPQVDQTLLPTLTSLREKVKKTLLALGVLLAEQEGIRQQEGRETHRREVFLLFYWVAGHQMVGRWLEFVNMDWFLPLLAEMDFDQSLF